MPSFHFSINPRSRKAGRFIRAVRQEIQKAVTEEKAERKLTQADLARALEIDRSVVNRQLTGEANLTLRSVSDYAWALGRDIEFRLVKPKEREGANEATAGAAVAVYMPSSLSGYSIDNSSGDVAFAELDDGTPSSNDKADNQ